MSVLDFFYRRDWYGDKLYRESKCSILIVYRSIVGIFPETAVEFVSEQADGFWADWDENFKIPILSRIRDRSRRDATLRSFRPLGNDRLCIWCRVAMARVTRDQNRRRARPSQRSLLRCWRASTCRFDLKQRQKLEENIQNLILIHFFS